MKGERQFDAKTGMDIERGYLQNLAKGALERSIWIFGNNSIAVDFLYDVDEVIVFSRLSRVQIALRGC